jgi:hypothetical protein
LQHAAQIVDNSCYLRMVWPEGRFINFQSAFIGGFGSGIICEV